MTTKKEHAAYVSLMAARVIQKLWADLVDTNTAIYQLFSVNTPTQPDTDLSSYEARNNLHWIGQSAAEISRYVQRSLPSQTQTGSAIAPMSTINRVPALGNQTHTMSLLPVSAGVDMASQAIESLKGRAGYQFSIIPGGLNPDSSGWGSITTQQAGVALGLLALVLYNQCRQNRSIVVDNVLNEQKPQRLTMY